MLNTMEESKQDNMNFLYHYQLLRFKQKSVINDPFQVCDIERKCTALAYGNSLSSWDNISSCMVLERFLPEYCNLVDKKGDGEVNNYAEPSLALAGHCRSEGQQWKSQLSMAHVEEMLKEDAKCDACDPTEDTISFLMQSYKENKSRLANCQGTKSFPTPSFPWNKNVSGGPPDFTRAPPVVTPSVSTSKFEPNPPPSGPSNASFMPRGGLHQGWQSEFTKRPLAQDSRNKYFGSAEKEYVASNEIDRASGFRTARDELDVQNQKKWSNRGTAAPPPVGGLKRSLGARRAVTNKFIPPTRPANGDQNESSMRNQQPEEPEDERLKGIEPKMVELIKNEIIDHGTPVAWDDIAGLEFAKATIQEIVVWPLLRPDIFTGLRGPPKGILLFGPPGTGKTLIGKCIASQSRSTFFSISASSLTSKWIGEGEKMVRALFAVARCYQPAVVFIDEIDSLLTQRSDTEHESSRRIKTEFLVQLDGAATADEERILVVGATNRPQELDEAARRRLVKRLYIPLPEHQARKQIIERLMSGERNCLAKQDVEDICTLTNGYSGADMKNLCQEAALGPIRSIDVREIHNITPEQVRPVTIQDFKAALNRVKASVSSSDLAVYETWDKQYGCGGGS